MKKYLTHEIFNEEMNLKMTRAEFLSPHINHSNSYINIRNLGLPSNIMSNLFKLKNDIFLTEERKYHCGISSSNRYIFCQKVDYPGHFLLCTKHNIQKICSKFVENCIKIDKIISTDNMLHMDLQGTFEEKFAIGWC